MTNHHAAVIIVANFASWGATLSSFLTQYGPQFQAVAALLSIAISTVSMIALAVKAFGPGKGNPKSK